MRPLRPVHVASERNRAEGRPVLVHQLIDWDRQLVGTNLMDEENVSLESNRQIDTLVTRNSVDWGGTSGSFYSTRSQPR